MSINTTQLKLCVIRPVLQKLSLASIAAENLLLGTAAQESHMGTYIKQVRGPALGIYQVEPATHDDVFENYLAYKKDLQNSVLAIGEKSELSLIANLAYATAIARICYLRAPEALPDADDVEGLAAYWKQYYNTPLGRGTEAEFIKNYKRFVL